MRLRVPAPGLPRNGAPGRAHPHWRLHTPVPDPMEDEEEPHVREPPVPPDQDDEVVPQREPPNPGERTPMIV